MEKNISYVIWGMGNLFFQYERYIDWDIVVAIIDNTKCKNIREYMNIPVASEKVIADYKTSKVVIFSQKYKKDIIDRLINSYYFPEDSILLWHQFLKERSGSLYFEEIDSFWKMADRLFDIGFRCILDKDNCYWRHDYFLNKPRHSPIQIVPDGGFCGFRSFVYDSGPPSMPMISMYINPKERYSPSGFSGILRSNTMDEYIAFTLPNGIKPAWRGWKGLELEDEVAWQEYEGRIETLYYAANPYFKWKNPPANNASDTVRIYIVAHKAVEKPIREKGYVYIQAGAEGRVPLPFQHDNEGDNISYLNDKINECTALYWIWKNDRESEILGLCHYRRFLVEEPFLYRDWRPITIETIRKYLEEYDILVEKPFYSGRATVGEQLKKTVSEAAFGLAIESVKKTIRQRCPQYEEAFNDCLCMHWFFPRNLFIARREVMDGYCQWLFDILLPVCAELDLSEYDSYSRRIIGFIAERMLSVWLRDKDYKIKTLQMVQTDQV